VDLSAKTNKEVMVHGVRRNVYNATASSLADFKFAIELMKASGCSADNVEALAKAMETAMAASRAYMVGATSFIRTW